MIEVHSLAIGYRRPILENLSLLFPPGRVTALLGPNGCGKSTLLKTMGGLMRPLEGRVLLDGLDLQDISPRERARRLSYLPQSRAAPAIPALSLALHGRFPHLNAPRRYRPEDWQIAREALAQVGMAALCDRDLPSLSGGQRQKVYLAMVLAQQTPVVLLDEPTTYLDVCCQLETWRLCRSMAENGKTVVAATHDLHQAIRYADQLLVLGDSPQMGTPEEILDSGVLERVFSVRITRFTPQTIGIDAKEENK